MGVVERAAALSAQMEALRVSEEQARARVRALEDEQLRIAQVCVVWCDVLCCEYLKYQTK